MLQQMELKTPFSVPPMAEGFNVNEYQPTLNHQIPQQSSRRISKKSEEAYRRNEPVARVKGIMVRELIENNEFESYSSEPIRGLGGEELEGEYRREKRPR